MMLILWACTGTEIQASAVATAPHDPASAEEEVQRDRLAALAMRIAVTPILLSNPTTAGSAVSLWLGE